MHGINRHSDDLMERYTPDPFRIASRTAGDNIDRIEGQIAKA